VLREREPEVAWRLLRRLLPRHHDSAFGNTVKTQFREWTPEAMPNVTHGEFWRGTGEIVDRMLRDVGRNGPRWCNLIEASEKLIGPHDTGAGRGNDDSSGSWSASRHTTPLVRGEGHGRQAAQVVRKQRVLF
jgi:hypothetical protein